MREPGVKQKGEAKTARIPIRTGAVWIAGVSGYVHGKRSAAISGTKVFTNGSLRKARWNALGAFTGS